MKTLICAAACLVVGLSSPMARAGVKTVEDYRDVYRELTAQQADPASAVNARYVGGQRLYLAAVDPAARATWRLDNTDLAAPVLTSSAAGRGHAAPPTASG